MDDDARLEAVEGRIAGLTVTLTSTIQCLLLENAGARVALARFLKTTAEGLRNPKGSSSRPTLSTRSPKSPTSLRLTSRPPNFDPYIALSFHLGGGPLSRPAACLLLRDPGSQTETLPNGARPATSRDKDSLADTRASIVNSFLTLVPLR